MARGGPWRGIGGGPVYHAALNKRECLAGPSVPSFATPYSWFDQTPPLSERAEWRSPARGHQSAAPPHRWWLCPDDRKWLELRDRPQGIRISLLRLAGLTADDGYEAILMQGSGTLGVESVIASIIPPQGRLLILANGAYGERIAKIATCLRINHRVLRSEENRVPAPREVENVVLGDPRITHIALVHCETTTGILNPLEPIAHVVERCQKSLIVDAMSSFGAISINLPATGIDYLVSSANTTTLAFSPSTPNDS